MIGAKSQKSIAGVAAFDQKKPFDAFVMGLNEPVQELVIHFSRPFQGIVSIRIVADGAQSRCVAEVIAEGGDLSARIGKVKGDLTWGAWGEFCRRLLENYQTWRWSGVYGTDLIQEVACWTMTLRSASPKEGLVRWNTLINIRGFDTWPDSWNLVRQALVRILLPLYPEGAKRALAKDALMKFLAAKAQIRHNR